MKVGYFLGGDILIGHKMHPQNIVTPCENPINEGM